MSNKARLSGVLPVWVMMLLMWPLFPLVMVGCLVSDAIRQKEVE